MNNTFESIKQGSNEAIQFAKGENLKARIFEPTKITVEQLHKNRNDSPTKQRR